MEARTLMRMALLLLTGKKRDSWWLHTALHGILVALCTNRLNFRQFCSYRTDYSWISHQSLNKELEPICATEKSREYRNQTKHVSDYANWYLSLKGSVVCLKKGIEFQHTIYATLNVVTVHVSAVGRRPFVATDRFQSRAIPYCYIFISEYFRFPFSLSFHQWSILIFVFLLVLVCITVYMVVCFVCYCLIL